MSLFNIPDEVIWEMSQPDFDGGDYYDPMMFETDPPPRIDFADVDPKNERHAAVFKGRSIQVVVACNRCGYPNLKWSSTPHGQRLTYITGTLTGKIHACESEAK